MEDILYFSNIFKELYKINEDIGEEFKAASYREIYIKLKILNENKEFKKSFQKDLDFKFKNTLTEIQNFKFFYRVGADYKTLKKENSYIQFNELFTKKTLLKIKEILETGGLKILDLKSKREIIGIRNLTQIFGVGPVTAKSLVKNGITNFKQYKESVKNTEISKIKKLGVKYGKMSSLAKNPQVTEMVVSVVQGYMKKFEKVILSGSNRIGSEIPSDIDLIICNQTGDISSLINHLVEKKILKDYVKSGENDIMGVIEWNKKYFRIDIKGTTRKHLATYLLYFGSGKYFSKFIRKIAKEKGYKLNQYYLENLKNGDLHFFHFEKEIFSFLQIPYIQPVDRFIYW